MWLTLCTSFLRSPLHRAVQFAKDHRITSLLLAHGGDLCTLTNDRKTPLHTFFNDAVERTLLSCTSRPFLLDFFEPDDRGRTLLHYLCWSSKCPPDTFRMVHTRSPSSINHLDMEGRSVLHFAAQRGNSVLIAYILSTTTTLLDINGRDYRGMTPMHYAVESRRAAKTIETLARLGLNSIAREHRGRSPLHLAAEKNNLHAVRALLELCPSPMSSELQVADRSGMTPLHVAEQSGSNAVAAFLRDVIGARDGDAAPFPQQPEDASPRIRQNVYEGGDRISQRVSGAVYSCASVLIAGVSFVLESGAVVFFCFAIGLGLFLSVLWRLLIYWMI